LSRYLAIDIEAQGLFVVAGHARAGRHVEHALAWVPGDDHGPPPLTPDTAKAVGEQLRDRLKAAGVAAAPVLVAVGRDKVILKELRHPPVPPAEEAAVVRFQALKEITESADDVVIDYVPLGTGAADPLAERRAMAVVVRKDVFNAVQTMCAAAGLKLAGVSPRPYAVAAGLGLALASGAAHHPSATTDAVAVLTLGPQGGEFTVVRGGQVGFTRSIPAPVLANDALLVGEVRRNLTVYGSQSPDHPIREVYVAEPEDLLGGWASRLRAGLSVPVYAFDPLGAEAAAVPPALRGRFAGAAGLLAGQAADALPINFAAPRQALVAVNPHRRQIALAALAAAVLVVGGAAFGFFLVSAADRDLAARQAEKASLEKELADAEPNRKRLEAADAWAGREVNYLDELFDMTDRFPAGDQLRAVEFKGTAIPPNIKTGKQDHQANFELKVGAKKAEAASNLATAIERDNVGGKKYYVGTQNTTGGLDTHPGVQHNQLFTLTTKVNRRPPAEYTDAPAFSPPPRRGIITLAPPTEEPPPPAASTGETPAEDAPAEPEKK
jgi:hypothetical protein